MTNLKRFTMTGSALAALVVGGWLALSGAGGGRVPDEVLHRPGAVPDRVILTWTGDPATTQAVTWRTDTSVEEPAAQIAVADDGPDFTRTVKKAEAVSQVLQSDLGAAKYHTAEFTGLTPNTLYVYRVGDGHNWSEWSQFRTAGAAEEPLTFLYLGDAQNQIQEHWSRVIRTAYSYAPRARFIIHAGDLVNHGNRDAEWGEWFRAAGWINQSLASVPAAGNHEYSRADGTRGLTEHWQSQFALPRNGPAGLEESCYYLDIQGVRIVTLNSSEKREEQAAWLDRLLAQGPRRWTIVTLHHPIFSSARGRDNRELRESWQPVFEKHGVDLVLQGHDHTYGRGNLTSGVNTEAGGHGTVYVVSVSGPKMYKLQDASWMTRVAERTQFFQVIRVNKDVLEYEARTARGTLYDAFRLRKRPGKPNEFTDLAPKTPPRVSADSGE